MGRGARGVSFDGGKLAGKTSETAHLPFHPVSFDTNESYLWVVPMRDRGGSTLRAWGNYPRRHDAIKTLVYIKI